MRRSESLILAIIALSFLVGAYFYPKMPESMASHWNAVGQVDGYLPKIWGVFVTPAILIILLFFIFLIPRIDPLKANIKKFWGYYDIFSVILALFFFYIYTLTILWNLGIMFDMVQFLAPAFAVLLYYTGVVIENSKRNWFIGIQTPWTLSSDRVWDKTHKLGGKLFKVTALVALFGIILPYYAILFILIPVVIVAVYTVVYSYFEYQRGH